MESCAEWGGKSWGHQWEAGRGIWRRGSEYPDVRAQSVPGSQSDHPWGPELGTPLGRGLRTFLGLRHGAPLGSGLGAPIGTGLRASLS